MELTKEQKIKLFEEVMWSYIAEEEMSRSQRIIYRSANCLYAGMCPRISNSSKSMFGEAVYATDILEFRAVTRKFNKDLYGQKLYFDAQDIKSRIEFIEICISIC